MDPDKLPQGLLDASHHAWYCPSTEATKANSPCKMLLDPFGITPKSTRRWRVGWGNPFAPVWFIGINPQIPYEEPQHWGEEDASEWSKDKALSGYGEKQSGYNGKHYNYHRDIMRMVAEQLVWPHGLLQDRTYVSDIILCGSPKAKVSEDMMAIAQQCASHHLFPMIRSLKPAVLVPVGLIPYQQIWQLLGGAETERWKHMREIQAKPKRLQLDGEKITLIPIPQPWQRWKSGEKHMVMYETAKAIAEAIDEAADNCAFWLRLTVGTMDETVGAVTADADGNFSYSGPKPDLVRNCIEGYRESMGLTGRALLRAMHRSPQSYWWTRLEEVQPAG